MRFRQVYFSEAVKLPDVWYHGSKADFDKFDLKYGYIEDKSAAQFGPGFYLAEDIDLAKHYAGNSGFVKTFKITRANKIYSSSSKPKLVFAKIAVDNIPEDRLETILSNWDQNPNKARKILSESLMDKENLGDQIQSIWIECFRYRESDFIKTISKLCDGVLYKDKGEKIMVAYNPEILKIVKTEKT